MDYFRNSLAVATGGALAGAGIAYLYYRQPNISHAPTPGIQIHIIEEASKIGPLVVDDMVATALKPNPAAYLGMATGSTPKLTGFWKELRRRATEEGVNFSQASAVSPGPHT